MKLVAFSDIHANLPALEAVLADIQKTAPDAQFIVAGDLVNCGAFPRETLAVLRGLPNALIIAGNHEDYVQNARTAQMSAPYRTLFAPAIWTAQTLDAEELDWLENLPREAALDGPDGATVRVVHGSPRFINEGIRPELTEHSLGQIFEGRTQARRLWLSGHTHRPVLFRWEGMTIANMGSVGMPYDDDTRAAYLVAEWDAARKDWYIEHHRVKYDLERTLQALRANATYTQGGPFMSLIAKCLEIGSSCFLRDFVNSYSALGEYPASPEDFPHLHEAVRNHLARFEAGEFGKLVWN